MRTFSAAGDLETRRTDRAVPFGASLSPVGTRITGASGRWPYGVRVDALRQHDRALEAAVVDASDPVVVGGNLSAGSTPGTSHRMTSLPSRAARQKSSQSVLRATRDSVRLKNQYVPSVSQAGIDWGSGLPPNTRLRGPSRPDLDRRILGRRRL